MEFLTKIIVLTVAGGVLLEILSMRIKRLKAVSFWVRLFGAFAVSVACVLAFWQTEEKPATPHDLDTIVSTKVDSLQQEVHRMGCDIDTLKADVRLLSRAESSDSLLRAKIRKQAICLDTIGRTALEKGVVSIGLERYDAALDHLDYALLAAEGDSAKLAETWHFIGMARTLKRDTALALEAYNNEVAFEHSSCFGWYNRGVILQNMGELESALASYDTVLIYCPDDHEAWHNRGFVQFFLNDYDSALASFDRALALDARDHETWHNKGEVLSTTSREREAIECFKKALELVDSYDNAWHGRGRAFARLSLLDSAAICYKRALSINPNRPDTWISLGDVYFHLHSYQHAIECYRRFLACDVSHRADAWNNLGRAQSSLGRHADALISWDSTLLYDPQWFIAWSNRAMTLLDLGKDEEALRSLDSALKYNPHDIVSIKLREKIMKGTEY